MFRKNSLGTERRRYIRMDSVFPVQFMILGLEGNNELSDWLQGFTNNVSKAGICLAVNNLKPELAKLIKDRQVKLSLDIQMPLRSAFVRAGAKVVWVKDVDVQSGKYLIGLGYEDIAAPACNRIVRYAIAKKLFVPVALTVIAVLAMGFALGSYVNIMLIKGNKALVEQLIRIVQESSIAKQTVKTINKEKDDLKLKMQALELRIKTAEEEKAALEDKTRLSGREAEKRIRGFNVIIQKLAQEKSALQEELIAVQHKENNITEELLRLDKKKATLEKVNLDKMYQWLKMRQDPRTGLVMSLEGDTDLPNWAFIYDQSLAAQLFTNFSDFERAKKILDFFARRAKRPNGLFYNAYFANNGSVAEEIVRSGPNIWIGIAALHYVKKSQDSRYLGLAEDIAKGIMDLQDQDSEGGLKGGLDIEWCATEHNLDAYAFFNMLYQITGEQKYLAARDKVLSWLLKHAYDKANLSVKRGRGDSTIATDTYAWSIAAIGPGKLQEAGMNPDMILDFAEKNCAAEVSYERPEGKIIKVRGFDFAPQARASRGTVVSSEWTAQMVISLRIMAEFYYKKNMIAKARNYDLKADEYLQGLANMVIASPSPYGRAESCLPYATEDSVDTGHGWSTPKGKSTGSLSGTVYTLFAYYNYNPLELK
ncbi:MAG: PilZ domain-containing protein [Candidatus Omnitrophica bacterium]|nr:PilZ domain-containing protein [Candidatus Omnitrophota bacterium]